MKVAINLPGSGADRSEDDFHEAVAFVVDAEKLGIDSVWAAEGWGMDCVVPMTMVAAKTSRVKVGSHIMQISARAPVNAAMTAMTLAMASKNRLRLGLGVSGPQVVEGMHGVPFANPAARMREYIEILRLAFTGAKIKYEGKHYRLPLPGGEGKPLRITLPPQDIPIMLGALGPKMLEITGELADGWLGTAFVPEHAAQYFDHIRAGAARRTRNKEGFDVQVQVPTGIASDPTKLIENRRFALAFQIGGMGSAKTNFYNGAFQRMGFNDIAEDVIRLWNEGDKKGATQRVTDEMVLKTSLIGDEASVRNRLRQFRNAGVTVIGVQPYGRSRDEKLETIERIVKMCIELDKEGPAPSVFDKPVAAVSA